MFCLSRLLLPVTCNKKYTLLWPFSFVEGYKNKNRERKRESTSNSYPNVPVVVAVRSGEERRSERGWQRDAGRETQAEMQAEPDIALAGAWAATRKWSLQQRQRLTQRESKSMWSGCSCCSPTDPARQSLSFSLALSLVLSAARVRPVSVCLAAVKPHAPKTMTKLCVWFIFVAFCVQVLFVFFIIYHYFLPASSFTDPHTHTQAHKLGYRATLWAVWATLRKIRHSLSNSLSRTRSMPNLSRITNNERNKNK